MSRSIPRIGLLIALALPGGLDGALAAGSCEPLRRLVSLADTRFDRLRGYFDPRLQAWVATYRMPGASLCTIEDDERAARYSCAWPSDPAAGTAGATYDTLLAQVDACLDVRAAAALPAEPDLSTARFGIVGARKSVVVSKHESPDRPHVVTLDIVPLSPEELGVQ